MGMIKRGYTASEEVHVLCENNVCENCGEKREKEDTKCSSCGNDIPMLFSSSEEAICKCGDNCKCENGCECGDNCKCGNDCECKKR